MFLDENGEYDRRKAVGTHFSAGVPGTVAGLAMALSDLEQCPSPSSSDRRSSWPVRIEVSPFAGKPDVALAR